MDYIKIKYYNSPYGELILGDYYGKLCICDWRYRKAREAIDSRIKNGLNADYKEEDSDLMDNAISQLEEYFTKQRKEFSIPMLFVGTDFQKSVWNNLLKVVYGTTDSYMGLAVKMNNTSAIRAIATANGANCLSIFVPCHRIIGSDNKLVGYAGGLSAKKKLLELESANNQLELF